MFGIGTPELIFIFLVGFFIFGPRQLPDIGRRLGELMAQLRRAADDFKQTWEAEVESERLRLSKDLSVDVKLPDLSVDLATLPPPEAEVAPAEGALSRTSIRPGAVSLALPPAEEGPAMPSDTLPVSPVETVAPAIDHLPVAPVDSAVPTSVPAPRLGAVETVEAIGYEG